MRFIGSARRAAAAFVVASALAGAPALAHHSFAPYEPDVQIALHGTVTHFQWTNPHIYLEIDAPDAETGEMKHWLIECANTSILNRAGWKFNMIQPGDEISIIVAPMRNGEPGALLKRVRLPDGTEFSNGPAAGQALIDFDGAPLEGASTDVPGAY